MAAATSAATTAVAAAAAEAAVARAGPNFRIGRRQIFMPKHIIALIHPTKPQPPNFARFSVPLSFNKLDLRDYLYHVYNVEVRSVRSMILPTPARQRISAGAGDGMRPAGPWQRPQPKKIMTVELVKPFVMPEKPKDLTPWDQGLYDRLRGEQELQAIKYHQGAENFLRDSAPPESLQILTAKEVQDLVAGKAKWKNDAVLDEKWTEMKRIEEAAKGKKK